MGRTDRLISKTIIIEDSKICLHKIFGSSYFNLEIDHNNHSDYCVIPISTLFKVNVIGPLTYYMLDEAETAVLSNGHHIQMGPFSELLDFEPKT